MTHDDTFTVTGVLPGKPLTVGTLKGLEDKAEALERTIIDYAYIRGSDSENALVLTFAAVSTSGWIEGVVWDPSANEYVQLDCQRFYEGAVPDLEQVDEEDPALDGSVIDDVEATVKDWVTDNYDSYHVYEATAITTL